jgi:ABC-type transporter Mla MlaB component
VALDVGKVERVDTSTMQLLCAFVRDRSAQQRKVEWVGDANVIREAARLLGVEELLSLPGATP